MRQYLLWLKERDALQADGRTVSDYLWSLQESGTLGPRSLFRKMESLRAFYRFQAAEERVARDPTGSLKAPRLAQRLPRYLTQDEMRALLERGGSSFAAVRTRTIVELLYATGMRAGELLALRPDGLNLSEGWVRVFGKGSKERLIPIHEKARAALARYLRLRSERFESPAPAVFLNRSGKPLSRVQLWRDLRRLGRKAGLSRELHPHLLRHTFASHLLLRGADPRALQEMLGHSQLTTTQIYTHLDKSALKERHQKHHPRG